MKIAIASGKGGTGKTMISTLLATHISKHDAVLLTDMDVEEPNDALFLGNNFTETHTVNRAIPEWDEDTCTHCGLCTKVCAYHAIIQVTSVITIFSGLCHSCGACSDLCPMHALPVKPKPIGQLSVLRDENMTFIESRINTGEEQVVPLIRHTFDFIKAEKNLPAMQLFDSPPGTSCPMLAVIREADMAVLVTEPTPFGLNDLKLAVASARQAGIPTAVIINRDQGFPGETEQFCHDEKIDIITRIPEDKGIAMAYASGQLINTHIPSLDKSIQDIYRYILTQKPTS